MVGSGAKHSQRARSRAAILCEVVFPIGCERMQKVLDLCSNAPHIFCTSAKSRWATRSKRPASGNLTTARRALTLAPKGLGRRGCDFLEGCLRPFLRPVWSAFARVIPNAGPMVSSFFYRKIFIFCNLAFSNMFVKNIFKKQGK